MRAFPPSPPFSADTLYALLLDSNGVSGLGSLRRIPPTLQAPFFLSQISTSLPTAWTITATLPGTALYHIPNYFFARRTLPLHVTTCEGIHSSLTRRNNRPDFHGFDTLYAPRLPTFPRVHPPTQRASVPVVWATPQCMAWRLRYAAAWTRAPRITRSVSLPVEHSLARV